MRPRHTVQNGKGPRSGWPASGPALLACTDKHMFTWPPPLPLMMDFQSWRIFCHFGQKCRHIHPCTRKQEAALTDDSATRILSSSLKRYFYFSCHQLQLHILKYLSLITKVICVYYKNPNIPEIRNSKCKNALYSHSALLLTGSQCSRVLYVCMCVCTYRCIYIYHVV